MFEPQEADHNNLQPDLAKLELGAAFVQANPDLDNLPDIEREAVIEQVAKMAMAAEIKLVNARLGSMLASCHIYECPDAEQRAVLMYTEKTKNGAASEAIWISAQRMFEADFSIEEIRKFGFDVGTAESLLEE